MKILTRYILTECFTFFGISLFAFTGILLTIQMLRFSDLIVNRGVDLSQIAMVFLAIIPTFLELAIPLAVLLGVMLAFARLSGDSEVVVLRASGLSIYQMLRPLLTFTLLVGIISLIVSTKLKPWGYQSLSDALFDIARSRSSAGLEPGIFNKLGDLTVYADAIDYSTGELTNALVDDRRDEKGRKIIFAKGGNISSDPERQTIDISLSSGTMHEQVEAKYVLTHFDLNTVSISTEDLYGDQGTKEKSPRMLSSSELDAQIARFAELATAPPDSHPDLASGKITNPAKKWRRLRMERSMRYSLPYATFVLGLCAMPLGIQPPRTHRTWGPSVSIGIGLFVFVVYYALLSLGITLVDSNVIAPWIASWIPNLFATVAAIAMVRGMGSERIQSISQVFEDLVRRIRIPWWRSRSAAS